MMSREPVHFQGRRSSLLIDVSRDDMPVCRHWGERLPAGMSCPPWDETAPVPSFSADRNVPLSLVPLFGDGWFGPSALVAARNGLDWTQGASGYGVERDGQAVTFVLRDEVAALELRQRLDLDAESDVLTLSCELVNLGQSALSISFLAAGSLPLPAQAHRVKSFSGRHNNEFVDDAAVLSRSGWHRQNRRGLTSHDCPPMASVLAAGADQSRGEVWSAQLAWSGNHVQSIDWLDDGRWLWMAGEWLAPGELVLAPGAKASTPEWLATYSPDGLDGAAQNFHTAIRARGPSRANTIVRPVHLNTWEGIYFDQDEAELMGLASEAAAIGIERFVLDDGWFRGRHDDRAALGDWEPDPVKYPNGLKPLATHVTGLGMQFGLWVEPEMINPDSDLYRAHPDWAFQIAERPARTARNQLALDLTRRDVFDHLSGVLDRLLTDLPISYLKWDHNRDLIHVAGADGRPRYREQVLAVYALIDGLRAAHPDVEIEACAGGGGRIDAGILKRTDRVWTSDCIDALSRIDIQRGFLQFFPPEIMGSHIGASPSHSTGRRQAMAFRAGVAMTGHFGVELDPRRISETDREQLAAWIAFYKQIRGRLFGGPVWRGEAGDHVNWQAHGSEAGFLLFVYRTAPTSLRYPPALRLPFVSEDGAYALKRIDPGRVHPGNAQPASFADPSASAMELHGAWLRAQGLPLPYLKAETCLVIEGTRL